MDAVFLPMLIASAVAMAVLGVWKVIIGPDDPDKRKLAERLSTEGRYDPAESAARAIRIQLEQANLPAALSRLKFLHTLHRHLAQAFPDMTLTRFLGFAVAGAFFSFSILLLLTASAIPALLGGAGAAYLPFFLLSAKRARRQKALGDQLPEALDFLSRALKAGHSLSTGLQMMADELPPPLSEEFRQCYDQHSLGQGLDDALKDMSARIGATDFGFFVTAVLIQRQTGGDLSEVLKNISGMIRQRVRLQQQVKAKTAEGRFTGYIMVAFPIVMFFIASSLNPEYAQILLQTPAGLKMLGTAFVLQIAGLIAIRKITTVKV